MTTETRPPSGNHPCYLYRVEEIHLSFPEFTEDFDGTDGRRTLMNLKSSWVKQARNLPNGTRFLVWVRQSRTFFADMGVVGSLEDGAFACRAHGFEPNGQRHGETWGRLYRPVRILARSLQPLTCTTLKEAEQRCGIAVPLHQASKKEIDAVSYGKLIAVIDWDLSTRLVPGFDVEQPEQPAVDLLSNNRASVLPRFDNAEQLLEQIRSTRDLPERNMENHVRELLLRLGHHPTRIVFQSGRIDLTLSDSSGKILCVFEVKRSLSSLKDRRQALRQAFDYANKTGAKFVVITDSDTFEIYDRTKGLDHSTQLQARFRLTEFKSDDEARLDLLRFSTY